MTNIYPNDVDIHGFMPERTARCGIVRDRYTGLLGRVIYINDEALVRCGGVLYEMEEES